MSKITYAFLGMDGGGFHSANENIKQFRTELGYKEVCCLFGFGIEPSRKCESRLNELLTSDMLNDEEERGMAYYPIKDVLREEWQRNWFRANHQFFCLSTLKNIYMVGQGITVKLYTKNPVQETTAEPKVRNCEVHTQTFTNSFGKQETIIAYTFNELPPSQRINRSLSINSFEMITNPVDQDNYHISCIPLDAPVSLIVVDCNTAMEKSETWENITTKDLSSLSVNELKTHLFIEESNSQVVYVQHVKAYKKKKKKIKLRPSDLKYDQSETSEITSNLETLTPMNDQQQKLFIPAQVK